MTEDDDESTQLLRITGWLPSGVILTQTATGHTMTMPKDKDARRP